MTVDKLKELLDEFLNRWRVDNIQNLTLQEYVGVGNKDTFCQWVETKTRMLGSIKGLTSIKFGIYERKDQSKKPKNYKNDDQYSWLQGYGDNRKTAFENTKRDLIKIIRLSEIGKFSEIDDIPLPDLFKWKVAFLYSNERLIPIYKRDVLFRIANHFGLITNRHTRISEIQNVMMLNKPAYLDVYAFMWQLFDRFSNNENKNEIPGIEERKSQRRTTRQATKGRNTTPQIRTVTRSYIAEQKHNKIQEALVRILSEKYGKENVILEENYVDIKLIQPRFVTFYEVKSSSYASECIKEALGQILLYSLNHTDKRPKKHIVVGQYPPTDNDKKYIQFLKQNLKLKFDYLNVEIE
ncbi:hypothetical protein H8B06_05965 [Sphingobacterium sp. DN00404]|uniref:Uncharacterized protein n=1 Tax=Sphingobacterium micropteri TaxID=2763501 RepID=A0ABR7YM16_9SPHI|nr:hypothetical protein [Sphingobacterium micropteri]MBD1432363.1 hypothetical protein [Sphingobacterium micropteri]